MQKQKGNYESIKMKISEDYIVTHYLFSLFKHRQRLQHITTSNESIKMKISEDYTVTNYLFPPKLEGQNAIQHRKRVSLTDEDVIFLSSPLTVLPP